MAPHTCFHSATRLRGHWRPPRAEKFPHSVLVYYRPHLGRSHVALDTRSLPRRFLRVGRLGPILSIGQTQMEPRPPALRAMGTLGDMPRSCGVMLRYEHRALHLPLRLPRPSHLDERCYLGGFHRLLLLRLDAARAQSRSTSTHWRPRCSSAIRRDPKTRTLCPRPYSRLRGHVRRVHPGVPVNIYSSYVCRCNP